MTEADGVLRRPTVAVRANRRGLSFVRQHERGPIEFHLSTNDPRAPRGGGLYAYVDPLDPDAVYIHRVDPLTAGRRGESEEKVMSRLLSHETLHAVLDRLDETRASGRLDSEIGVTGTFAPFHKVTATGLMRKGSRRMRR